jgi:hypothetical protein
MTLKISCCLVWMLAASGGFASAADRGASAQYVGGTLDSLEKGAGGSLLTADAVSLEFRAGKFVVRVPYERIRQIEYGQKVNRRMLEAVLLSPLLILSKKRAHFLAVSFEAEQGAQQAMVFRVDKDAILPLLVSLEARTGLKVTFMDEEARRAGKG